MRSTVDICNLALSHIGQSSITSLTETSNDARKCNLSYTFALESVLRAHDWNFATKVEVLAQIADEEIPGWTYVYARPNNCLFIRRIFNENSALNQVPEKFREIKTNNNQKAIVCDVDFAYIEYTQKVTDPNDFDSIFVEALSYKLAGLICKGITGDAKLAEAMEQKYLVVVSDARRLNSSERNLRNADPYVSYIEARG